jgi:hypothetical protein
MQIATSLIVAEATVKTHVRNIFPSLTFATAAIVFGYDHGVITPATPPPGNTQTHPRRIEPVLRAGCDCPWRPRRRHVP